MITKQNSSFLLQTEKTSYCLSINELGKPVLDFYGSKIAPQDAPSAHRNPSLAPGRSIVYDQKHPNLALSCLPLESSTSGKGYFQTPSLIVEGEGLKPLDFIFKEERLGDPVPMEGYPMPDHAEEELTLILLDEQNGLELELHYITFAKQNVIGRYAKFINRSGKGVKLRRLSSLCLDLEETGFSCISYRGGWIDEFHEEKTPLSSSRLERHSTTGSSSDLHNPFFYLVSEEGECYGFNLIYSGNHEEILEQTSMGITHVLMGVDSTSFLWEVENGKSFLSPMAILTYGESEMEMTSSFHRFVNECVLPKANRLKARPILLNNWEATYFAFNESKLHSLAKKAKALGVEAFVLDDGWFGHRDDDHSSLGDYAINSEKLPHGIEGLSSYVHKLGMLFGLWFEPESVSVDSELYSAHPDWAVAVDGIEPSQGRNQLLLDLTKKEVTDYLYENISKTIEEGHVDFIKWDYNRVFSDTLPPEGNFAHAYILSLYSLLSKLRQRFPSLWMENCASGGSRNDLGMFSFFDTGWVSDNTDSFSRCLIQKGMIKAYPQSLMSNHVSAKTSHQTLRKTSLGTKFDVACFGVLGYELNVLDLTPLEEKEIENQIKYYKEIRNTAQFGEYALLEDLSPRKGLFQELKDNERILVNYVRCLQVPNPGYRRLPKLNADLSATYSYSVREESVDIRRMGGLINMASPIHLKEEGVIVNFIANRKGLDSEKWSGEIAGGSLRAGCLPLPQEWNGTGIGESVALILDFGARIYRFEAKKEA